VIGATGTSSAYGKEATAQAQQANFWRWVAVAVGLLALVVAGWAILESGSQSAARTAAKTAGTLAVLGVAGYAAGQSADHRRRKVAARRLELELTVFGPFIQELPTERQIEVRTAVVERLFGNADPSIDDSSSALTKNGVSVVSQIADVLLRMRK
jgi:hypothetical protein